MKPISTEHTNLTLIHEHAGDLPSQVLITGTIERPMAGILSVWRADPDERARLAAGADLELIHEIAELQPGLDLQAQMRDLHAAGHLTHPAVALTITDIPAGDPPAPAAGQIDRSHLNRALGYLFGHLNANPPPGTRDANGVEHGPFDYILQHRDLRGEWLPAPRYLDPAGFLNLFERALAATREAPGDGPSIADLSLPSDIRGEL